MKALRHLLLSGLPALLLFCQGCRSDVVFQEQQTLPSEGWHYRDCIHLEAEIYDSLSLHRLYLDVRNTTDYAYSNLFIFLDIDFPDDMLLRDTIACILADRRGRWTGSGIGNIRSNRFLFRDDVWFPYGGTYRFSICHGMRYEVLEGISEVGIRIEKK